MERRSALKLIAGTVLAERLDAVENQLFQIARSPGTYSLQFFTAPQNAAVDAMMERIIPADEHSPGASEAKTSLFADLIVANSDNTVRQQWQTGLAAVEAYATQHFGGTFASLPAAKQDELLTAASRNEAHPSTDLERFFVLIKLMTINGYYTSATGIHRELQYKGNTALPDYYGCTHPEHQSPEPRAPEPKA